MKILSQEETSAIVRPCCTSMDTLCPKEVDDHVTAFGKEGSSITDSKRILRRNEATEVVRGVLIAA